MMSSEVIETDLEINISQIWDVSSRVGPNNRACQNNKKVHLQGEQSIWKRMAYTRAVQTRIEFQFRNLWFWLVFQFKLIRVSIRGGGQGAITILRYSCNSRIWECLGPGLGIGFETGQILTSLDYTLENCVICQTPEDSHNCDWQIQVLTIGCRICNIQGMDWKSKLGLPVLSKLHVIV